MKPNNYCASFTVTKTAGEAFEAIKNVRGWWSEDIEGSAGRLGAEFKYRYKDVHHCKVRIVEFSPPQRIAWLVLDNYFGFTTDKTEWKGTKIIFEIFPNGGRTEVRFTHFGLVPDYECYDVCTDAWSTYIKGSLRKLIATGHGQPTVSIADTVR